MRPLIISIIILLFHWENCHGHEDSDMDTAINCVFDPRNLDTTQNGGTNQCHCVHYTRCNSTINHDCKGIVSSKYLDFCNSKNLVCCHIDNIKTEPTPPPKPVPNESSISQCGQRNPEGAGYRIMGNDGPNNQAMFGEFPWMVAVLYRVKKTSNIIIRYKCGGTLIHPYVVVTTAHCVADERKQFLIRAGEWDVDSKNELLPHQDREVKEIVKHESFYSGGLYNDIALLILKDPIQIQGHIDVICLPPLDMSFDGSRCFASGWGMSNFTVKNSYQKILKKIDLPIVNRDVCQRYYREKKKNFILHSSFICAGGEAGKDTCIGDGGSPLVCPISGTDDLYMLAGIVSWGFGCGLDNLPGVYVNVPLFRVWIDEQMKLKGYDIFTYVYKA